MKDMRYYLQLMLLACCVCFTACSDDDDDQAEPVFPQSQNLSCAVGDEKVLTFEATDDWTLTSSALWCAFVKGDEKVYSCSGAAGKASVTVTIGDEASELLKSYQAELTLMMGGKRQVIYTLTRPVTGYEIQVFNEDETVEYTSEQPMIQDYDGRQRVVVKANFDWKMVLPEALEADVISGMAGEKVLVRPALVNGFTKEAWSTVLAFKNKNDEVVAEAPVQYDGIPADRIEFSNQNPMGTTITFSAYGDSYKIGEVEYEGGMSVEITAREDKYTVVYVDYKEEYYEYEFTRLTEEDTWFFAEDNGAGKIEVTAGYNNEKEKTGYLMVFPNAVYEEIQDHFESAVFSIDGLKDPYSRYVAMSVAQEANPRFTTGFTITDGEGNPLVTPDGEVIEAYSYQTAVGDKTDEELITEYGTSNVYLLALPSGVAYDVITIIPNGFPGFYVQPNTYLGEYPDGYDTVWDGVYVDTDWNMTNGKGVNINNIGVDTNGDANIVIKCLNNDAIHAVMLVTPRY